MAYFEKLPFFLAGVTVKFYLTFALHFISKQWLDSLPKLFIVVNIS